MIKLVRGALELPEYEQLQMFIDDGSDVSRIQKSPNMLGRVGLALSTLGVGSLAYETTLSSIKSTPLIVAGSIASGMGVELVLIPYFNRNIQPNDIKENAPIQEAYEQRLDALKDDGLEGQLELAMEKVATKKQVDNRNLIMQICSYVKKYSIVQ